MDADALTCVTGPSQKRFIRENGGRRALHGETKEVVVDEEGWKWKCSETII